METLKRNLENKQRVIDAATYAIQEISLLHNPGKGFEKSAIGAVAVDIDALQGPAGEDIADLRNIARDAVEGILLTLGYDQPEIMGDFDISIEEQLSETEPVE